MLDPKTRNLTKIAQHCDFTRKSGYHIPSKEPEEMKPVFVYNICPMVP